MAADNIRWHWEADTLSETPRQLRLRLSDGRWTEFILPLGAQEPTTDNLGDPHPDVFDLNTPSVLRDLRIQFFGRAGEKIGEVATATDAGAVTEPDFAWDLMNPEDYGKKRRRSLKLPQFKVPGYRGIRVIFAVGSAAVIVTVALVLGHSVLSQTDGSFGSVTAPSFEPGSPVTPGSTSTPTPTP